MNFRGYLLPNLVLFLVIVFAWFNIDLISKRFSININPSSGAAQATPIFVMQNGKQDYYQDNYLNYRINYTEFTLYQENKFNMLNPYLQGYNPQAQLTNQVRADKLDSADGNNLIFAGAPATIIMTTEESLINGSAPKIYYDVKAEEVLLADKAQITYIRGSIKEGIKAGVKDTTKESPSNNEQRDAKGVLSTADSEPYTINSKANTIKIKQQIATFNGQADIIYKKEGQQLQILRAQAKQVVHDASKNNLKFNGAVNIVHRQGRSQGYRQRQKQQQEEVLTAKASQAEYNTKNNNLALRGNVEIVHNKDGKLVQASGDSGDYAEDSLILRGNVRIKDGSRSAKGEQVSYDVTSGEWNLVGKSSNEIDDSDKSEDAVPLDDKIEIIIPK